MNCAGELFDAFRDEVVDNAKPYLWSNPEVWRYMNDAYRMFTRLTGGIADVTSALTRIQVTPGEYQVKISKLILRIESAELTSLGRRPVNIVNYPNLPRYIGTDYGISRSVVLGQTTGQVKLIVIGRQKGLVELVHVPVEEDEIQMAVRRLPLNTLKSREDKLDEIEEEHHEHLLKWMKHLAYLKEDADTFDKAKSDNHERAFVRYCEKVTSEFDRLMVKTGEVAYGGI